MTHFQSEVSVLRATQLYMKKKQRKDKKPEECYEDNEWNQT